MGTGNGRKTSKKKRVFKDWYEENADALNKQKKKRYAKDSAYREAGKSRVRDKYKDDHNIFPDGSRLVKSKRVKYVAIKLSEAADKLGINLNTLSGYYHRKYFPVFVFDDTKLKLVTVDQLSLLQRFVEVAAEDGAASASKSMKKFLKKNWRNRSASKEIINQKG